MSLKDYLEANKNKSKLFVALYNKEDKWIIAGLVDDSRLVDYYSYNILSESKVSANIVKLQTDYPDSMQVGYYSARRERARTAADESDSSDSKGTKRVFSKKKKK